MLPRTYKLPGLFHHNLKFSVFLMMYFNLENTFLLVHITEENFLIKVDSKRVVQYQSPETITLCPKRTHTNFIQNSISGHKQSTLTLYHIIHYFT